MFTEDEKTLIVTKVISPNHFYLYDSGQSDIHFLNKLEQRIAKEVKISLKAQHQRDIEIGDVVAYYWLEGKRYIRCKVDGLYVFNDKTQAWCLFSLDYGVSIQTSTRLHKLPESFKHEQTAVIGPVSLELAPFGLSTEFLERKDFDDSSTEWPTTVMHLFHLRTTNAVVIKFIPSETIETHRGFVFGDLILTSADGREYSLSDELVTKKYADACNASDEFYTRYLSSSSVWADRFLTVWGKYEISKGGEYDYVGIYCFRDLQFKRNLRILALQKRRQRTSIEKVLAWKESIRGYEHFPPIDEIFENNTDNDEGYSEEKNQSTSSAIIQSPNFRSTSAKRAKKNADEMEINMREF